MNDIYFAHLIYLPFKGISHLKSKNSSGHNHLFTRLICFPHKNSYTISPSSHLFNLFQTHSNKITFSHLQGHLHICISHGLTFGLLAIQSVTCHNNEGTVCTEPASVTSEVLTAVLLKIQIFWDVTLCHCVTGEHFLLVRSS